MWEPSDTSYPNKFYYNGTLKNKYYSGFLTQSNILTIPYVVSLQNNQYRYAYHIKDLRIYNRVLTASEIAQL